VYPISKHENYLQNLNKRDFEKYLIISLIGIAIATGIFTYYLYSQSSSKISQLKKLEDLANKASIILSNNKKMQVEEERLKQLLEQEKEFSIKTFFEQFIGEQGITPEPGWNATTQPLAGSDKFDEVILSAIFKGQTTQKLVKVLDALDKKEIVYIKELKIKNEDNKKITAELAIATKKYKR